MHLSRVIAFLAFLFPFVAQAEDPSAFAGYESVLGVSGPKKDEKVTSVEPVAGESDGKAVPKVVETPSSDSQALRDALLGSRSVEPPKASAPSITEKPDSDAVVGDPVDEGGTNALMLDKANEKANARLASRYTTRRELDMKSGENRILYMSLGNLNRIITPFKNPKIFHTGNESTTRVFKEKNVVYVGTSDVKPFGVFISPEDNPEVSINLTVSPEALTMPQEYKVILNGYEEIALEQKQDEKKESATEFEKLAESDYQSWIKGFAKTLISGELPPGYSPEPGTEKGGCVQPNLTTELYQRLVGGEYTVDVYRVKNGSQQTHIIQERFCYKKGVRFILAWEDAQLPPGGESDLFVVRENTVESVNERPKYGSF